MANQTLARRYALAIFNLAQERGEVGRVGSDLRAAASAIESDDDARRFFRSPVVDRKVKENVFASVLAGLQEIARHAVLLLIRKRRESLLGTIVAQYDDLALADAGRARLEVVSAKPLGDAALQDIVTRLSRHYGTFFQLEHRVDPALLGGLQITMGDRRIDGSVAGRLDDLARDLFAQHHPG